MKFSDRTWKIWPFNTGDCLIEVTVFVLFIVFCVDIFNSNIVASNDMKENIDFLKELYKMIAFVELEMFI